MKIIYFEGLEEGSVHWGAECLVDKEEMLTYSVENDPWPFHVDEAAAARSPFGGLIASGGYTITLMYRSSITIYNTPESSWAFLGGFEWQVKFLLPVRVGDRLRHKITVLSKRLFGKPGRGVVQLLSEMVNQNGQVVCAIESKALLATQPRGEA